jgi:hypothetical protein
VLTCELCHHEASLPANRWDDGVLVSAFRVYARGSIRNYDDLDSQVAQAQLVASLVAPV